MAKKLVKKRRIIPWGLIVLVFFIALSIYGTAKDIILGGATLNEWYANGLVLAFLSSILLWYLEQKNFGGERWKNHLRVGFLVMLSLFAVFLLLSMSLEFHEPS